jgi:hypothetical protein
VTNPKYGKCQDIWCEEPEEPDYLTRLSYIESNKAEAWVCQGCLETWSDALEDYTANMGDFDLGGYPMIP